MTRILAAYDGSEEAHHALESVVRHFRAGDVVTVIHVTPAVTAGQLVGIETPSPERVPRVIDDARALLTSHDIDAIVVERFGDPGSLICEEVEKGGFDKLVIGDRHHNLLERAVIGSVKSWVEKHPPCEVLIVR